MHPEDPTLLPSGAPAFALDRASFLRKVYLLMTGAVLTSGATAALATYAGADAAVRVGQVSIPPMIAWSLSHPWIMLGLLLASTFGAGAVVRKPGLNLVGLFGMAGLMGLYVAPVIFYAQLKASMGQALTSSPVLHASAVAVAGFAGLSGYALTTKRDFSALGGFLSMGLFVVIGASILNIFLGATALSMAVASVTVLLFGGFVLYDTQRMLTEGEDEPVAAALQLYLNFLNLFLALLRIFTGGRRDLLPRQPHLAGAVAPQAAAILAHLDDLGP